jgi:hypothetical protein
MSEKDKLLERTYFKSNEDDKLLTGKITNVESGESWSVEFRPFLTDSTLMATVKVEKTEIHENTITVECKALDSIGAVFFTELMFTPETVAKRERIIADMIKDAIFLVNGRYSICQNELIVVIYDPGYLPLPPELSEKEVREVFKVNENPLAKVH